MNEVSNVIDDLFKTTSDMLDLNFKQESLIFILDAVIRKAAKMYSNMTISLCEQMNIFPIEYSNHYDINKYTYEVRKNCIQVDGWRVTDYEKRLVTFYLYKDELFGNFENMSSAFKLKLISFGENQKNKEEFDKQRTILELEARLKELKEI